MALVTVILRMIQIRNDACRSKILTLEPTLRHHRQWLFAYITPCNSAATALTKDD